MSLKVPQGQKRLTNIAVCRLVVERKRFEVACYPNKVADFRSGREKHLQEVLQSWDVFSEVQRGVWAKAKDIEKCFGTRDEAVVCERVVREGVLQVTEQERSAQHEENQRALAFHLQQRLMDGATCRRLNMQTMLGLMKAARITANDKEHIKKQALKAVDALLEHPASGELVARVPMRLALRVVGAEHVDGVRVFLASDQVVGSPVKGQSDLEGTTTAAEADGEGLLVTRVLVLCAPAKLRVINEAIAAGELPGVLGVEVVDQAIFAGGELSLDEADLAPTMVPKAAPADAADAAAGATPSGASVPPGHTHCSRCQLAIPSQEFREHNKTALHTHNVKRTANGEAPLTDAQFREWELDQQLLAAEEGQGKKGKKGKKGRRS